MWTPCDGRPASLGVRSHRGTPTRPPAYRGYPRLTPPWLVEHVRVGAGQACSARLRGAGSPMLVTEPRPRLPGLHSARPATGTAVLPRGPAVWPTATCSAWCAWPTGPTAAAFERADLTPPGRWRAPAGLGCFNEPPGARKARSLAHAATWDRSRASSTGRYFQNRLEEGKWSGSRAGPQARPGFLLINRPSDNFQSTSTTSFGPPSRADYLLPPG